MKWAMVHILQISMSNGVQQPSFGTGDKATYRNGVWDGLRRETRHTHTKVHQLIKLRWITAIVLDANTIVFVYVNRFFCPYRRIVCYARIAKASEITHNIYSTLHTYDVSWVTYIIPYMEFEHPLNADVKIFVVILSVRWQTNETDHMRRRMQKGTNAKMEQTASGVEAKEKRRRRRRRKANHLKWMYALVDDGGIH